jgi:hypothetical protein
LRLLPYRNASALFGHVAGLQQVDIAHAQSTLAYQLWDISTKAGSWAALPTACHVLENQMKLYASDNSDLMEISKIYPESGNLIVEGTIMGAMPIRAIVKPAEVRKALGLMSMKTMLFAFVMLFRGSR